MDTTEATPNQVARLQTILSMPLWVARLQTILSMPLRTDTPEILALLERLAGAAATVEMLRETRALAAVSSRFLRCHRDARIRARSQELVVQWRALAAGTDEEVHSSAESTTSTAISTSSAALALGRRLATAGARAGADADAPAPPGAGPPAEAPRDDAATQASQDDAATQASQDDATTEASQDDAGRMPTRPASESATMDAVDFLARCSATLQRHQRKASRRAELRRLGSGGFSPRKDHHAKVKHDQQRKEKKVKPTIDKKENRLGTALVMRVGAQGRATWGGGGH